MRRGDLVIDGRGVHYYSWFPRHDYLEVMPLRPDGRPEVHAGSSIRFHLVPETAHAYPERRHDPVRLAH